MQAHHSHADPHAYTRLDWLVEEALAWALSLSSDTPTAAVCVVHLSICVLRHMKSWWREEGLYSSVLGGVRTRYVVFVRSRIAVGREDMEDVST